MKLNARQVETAKPKDKPYKLADGGGGIYGLNPNEIIRIKLSIQVS